MNKFEYKKICPFKWFVIQNFPFIEADFDAITNYQLFCKVVEYLNKVIDDMNITGQQMENLTNAMIELENYVNNLDLQDEVNNKLDEMYEDGLFDNLLSNFLSIQKIYDTTQDLINDKNNLVNGQKIKTLGYYNINDGGGSDIFISNELNKNNYQIDLENGLYINIIFKDNINVLQIGTPADGENNDSPYFQKAIDFAYISALPVYIPTKKRYLINTTLNLQSNKCLRIYGDISNNAKYGNYIGMISNTDVFTIPNATGTGKRTKLFIENLGIKCLDGDTNNTYSVFKNIIVSNSIIKSNRFYGFGYILYNSGMDFGTQIHDNNFLSIKKCFFKMNDGTSAIDGLSGDSFIYNNYINADRGTNAIFFDGTLDDDFEIYENYIDFFMYICTFTASGINTCNIGNLHNNTISAFRFGNRLTRGHIVENVFEGFHKENMAYTNPTSLMTNGKFGVFIFEDNDLNYEPDYAFSLWQSEVIDNVIAGNVDYFIRVVVANATTGVGGTTKWRYVKEKGTIIKERVTTPSNIQDKIQFYIQTAKPLFRTTRIESLNNTNISSGSLTNTFSYVNSNTAETVTFTYYQVFVNNVNYYNDNVYLAKIDSNNDPSIVQITTS